MNKGEASATTAAHELSSLDQLIDGMASVTLDRILNETPGAAPVKLERLERQLHGVSSPPPTRHKSGPGRKKETPQIKQEKPKQLSKKQQKAEKRRKAQELEAIAEDLRRKAVEAEDKATRRAKREEEERKRAAAERAAEVARLATIEAEKAEKVAVQRRLEQAAKEKDREKARAVKQKQEAARKQREDKAQVDARRKAAAESERVERKARAEAGRERTKQEAKVRREQKAEAERRKRDAKIAEDRAQREQDRAAARAQQQKQHKEARETAKLAEEERLVDVERVQQVAAPEPQSGTEEWPSIGDSLRGRADSFVGTPPKRPTQSTSGVSLAQGTANTQAVIGDVVTHDPPRPTVVASSSSMQAHSPRAQPTSPRVEPRSALPPQQQQQQRRSPGRPGRTRRPKGNFSVPQSVAAPSAVQTLGMPAAVPQPAMAAAASTVGNEAYSLLSEGPLLHVSHHLGQSAHPVSPPVTDSISALGGPSFLGGSSARDAPGHRLPQEAALLPSALLGHDHAAPLQLPQSSEPWPPSTGHRAAPETGGGAQGDLWGPPRDDPGEALGSLGWSRPEPVGQQQFGWGGGGSVGSSVDSAIPPPNSLWSSSTAATDGIGVSGGVHTSARVTAVESGSGGSSLPTMTAGTQNSGWLGGVDWLQPDSTQLGTGAIGTPPVSSPKWAAGGGLTPAETLPWADSGVGATSLGGGWEDEPLHAGSCWGLNGVVSGSANPSPWNSGPRIEPHGDHSTGGNPPDWAVQPSTTAAGQSTWGAVGPFGGGGGGGGASTGWDPQPQKHADVATHGALGTWSEPSVSGARHAPPGLTPPQANWLSSAGGVPFSEPSKPFGGGDVGHSFLPPQAMHREQGQAATWGGVGHEAPAPAWMPPTAPPIPIPDGGLQSRSVGQRCVLTVHGFAQMADARKVRAFVEGKFTVRGYSEVGQMGCALVELESETEATLVMEMLRQVHVNGQLLNVDFASPDVVESFRQLQLPRDPIRMSDPRQDRFHTHSYQ
jgi:hypothetical protein